MKRKSGCNYRHSQRFHWSPVVVLLLDGPLMGTRPQCGPSMVGWIWISWWWLPGRSWMRQSSDRRTIRVLEKRHRTLMLPTSWSDLPPSCDTTLMKCRKPQIICTGFKLLDLKESFNEQYVNLMRKIWRSNKWSHDQYGDVTASTILLGKLSKN